MIAQAVQFLKHHSGMTTNLLCDNRSVRNRTRTKYFSYSTVVQCLPYLSFLTLITDEKLVQKHLQNCIVSTFLNKLLNLNQIFLALFTFEFRLSRTIVIYQFIDFLATSTMRNILEGGFIAVMIGNPATGGRKSRLALQYIHISRCSGVDVL